MDWYKVVKTINGRKYLYLQKTYRDGGSVKTLNRYIGPATSTSISPTAAGVRHRAVLTDPPITTRPSVAQTTVPTSAPNTPEHAVTHLTPLRARIDDPKLRRWIERLQGKIREEDEAIQYGPRKARIKRMKAKVRAAKRKTKGVKALNPFIAQMLVNKKL
jgi:hypothetical protein